MYVLKLNEKIIQTFCVSFTSGVLGLNPVFERSNILKAIRFVNSRPFNLHPEKWFEGYPVKSTL